MVLAHAASGAWLILGLVTVASSMLSPATLFTNAVVSTVFLAAAFLLAWKAHVLRCLPTSQALASLYRVETATGAVMLLLGAVLLTAALYRVLVERLPVFG